MTPRRKFYLLLLSLAGLLLAAVIWSAAVGDYHISVARAFTDRGSIDGVILWQTRLPRVLFAIIVGAALGISGASVQGLFRNPLATPYTLGVSGGASLGAVFALHFLPSSGWGFSVVILSAFVMAILTIALVYALAGSGAGLRLMTLLLAGVIINVITSSAILLFEYVSGFSATLRILHWLMGDLAVVGYGTVAWITPIIIIGAVVLLTTAKPLNAVSIGEDTAQSMGVSMRSLERKIYFAASFCVAAVVAAAGPIGFIGLVAPHILRMIIGPDARLILPGSMMLGAILLLVADTAARTVLAPTEIPVGVFTAAFGGTFFLYLLWKSRRNLWV